MASSQQSTVNNSASASQTNFFRQKQVLKEEEKSLMQMLDKFNDQLNRLKIEELALFTLMKMQNSSSNAGPAPVEDADRKRTSSVGSASIASGNSFIPVATVESASSINAEALNLDVNSEFMRQVMTMENLEEDIEEMDSDSEDSSDDEEM